MDHNMHPIPLLSIVIPTRNRVSYAISAIQSIVEISDPRLELVVQDNSDNRDLEKWLQTNINDSRLCYHYSNHPLSFIHNFNMAVELATGEYICFIGDDDGVNPKIMEAAAWAKSDNLDSLVVNNKVNYLWPGTPISFAYFTKPTAGSLSICGFRGSLIEADMEKEMRKFVRDGGVHYMKFKLPKLYHGLVNRRCLKAIHEKTGAYFGGLSPDIYASLAIACVAKRVVVTDYPLTIPGACRASSTVVEGVMKKHSKKLEDAPHLRYRGEYHWCELVPRVYSVESIWVDSGVAALRAMGRDDLVRELNLPKLAAYCMGGNRGVTWPVLRDLFAGLGIMDKSCIIGAIQVAWNLLINSAIRFTRRVWNRFLMIIGVRDVCNIHDLDNMVEASHALTCYLKENGHSFSGCVRR